MDCDDISFWLAAAADAPPRSAADDAERARHLEACDTCRALFADRGDAVAMQWVVGIPTDALADRDLLALPTVDPIVFEVGAELARGGMGRVLRARDRRLGRDVAIKEVLDPQLQARFEREVAITARLQHPSIVPIYEAGRWPDGAAYYAMRLVSGGTLASAIHQTRTLEDRLALLPHVLALTDALAYAHAQRIVHRDLKPGNVLVGEFGETIVIDWGIAKELDRAIDDVIAPPGVAMVSGPTDATMVPAAPAASELSTLTVVGSVMGTPGFMSPEQATGGDVDERTDVYALGAILYNLLAGHIPYGEARATTLTPQRVVERALAGAPPPLATLVPRVPVDLQAIVERAMARDRTQRFANAQELAEELRRFAAGQLLRSRDYTTGERIARWVRKHRVIVTITSVALVGLAALAIVSVRQTVRRRETAERGLAQSRVEQARQLVVAGHPGQAAALLVAALDHVPDDDLAQRLAAIAVRDAERRLASFPGTAAAFRPDGRALAIAGPAGIRFVDPDTGAVQATLADVGDRPIHLAYAGDGARLLVVSRSRVELVDGTALPFGSAAGRGSPAVEHLEQAPPAAHVIARGDIATAELVADRIAVATAAELQLVERDRVVRRDAIAGIRALDVSPDGTRLLGLAPSATIVWSLPELARVASLPAARSARFTADGSVVLADNDAVRRFPPGGAAPIVLRAGEAQPLIRLRDGSLATGAELFDLRDDTTRLLPDAISGVLIAELDATHVVISGFERTIRIVRLDLPHPLAVLEAADVPDDLRASPTGTRVVSVDHGGTIELWDTGGLREPQALATLDAPIERLVADPHGAIAAWLHADASSRVALLRAGGVFVRTVPGWPVGLRPDGGVLAVNDGGHLMLYATEDGAQIKILADAATIQAAAFSPSGALLATAAAGRITLRDAHSWAVVGAFDTRTGDVSVIALDDHDHIVTGHDDGALRFWTHGAGPVLAAGHRAHVEDLAIQGDRVVSVGWDRTTRAWDVATGAARGVVLPGIGRALALSPSGDLLATVEDGTLSLWDARDGRLVEQRPAGAALGGIAFATDDRVVVGDGPRLLAIPVGAPTRSAADLAHLADSLGWRVVDGRLIENPSRP